MSHPPRPCRLTVHFPRVAVEAPCRRTPPDMNGVPDLFPTFRPSRWACVCAWTLAVAACTVDWGRESVYRMTSDRAGVRPGPSGECTGATSDQFSTALSPDVDLWIHEETGRSGQQQIRVYLFVDPGGAVAIEGAIGVLIEGEARRELDELVTTRPHQGTVVPLPAVLTAPPKGLKDAQNHQVQGPDYEATFPIPAARPAIVLEIPAMVAQGERRAPFTVRLERDEERFFTTCPIR